MVASAHAQLSPLIITVRNMFLLVVTVGNRFLLVITVEDTFPPLMSV